MEPIFRVTSWRNASCPYIIAASCLMLVISAVLGFNYHLIIKIISLLAIVNLFLVLIIGRISLELYSDTTVRITEGGAIRPSGFLAVEATARSMTSKLLFGPSNGSQLLQTLRFLIHAIVPLSYINVSFNCIDSISSWERVYDGFNFNKNSESIVIPSDSNGGQFVFNSKPKDGEKEKQISLVIAQQYETVFLTLLIHFIENKRNAIRNVRPVYAEVKSSFNHGIRPKIDPDDVEPTF